MSDEKTPWNPSKTAIKRVKNHLPSPTTCPYCNGNDIQIKNNAFVYSGKSYGKWPWIYVCMNSTCRSYVGMHPYTNIPLGTLADSSTRKLRKDVKSYFYHVMEERNWDRNEMYKRLAHQMNIPVQQCHFGWFDVQQCQQANLALEELYHYNDIKSTSPFAKLNQLLG